MGNFRHQSLRTADRERERDSERERQRDERDREGQERLRNVRLLGFYIIEPAFSSLRSYPTNMTESVWPSHLRVDCVARSVSLHLI